MPGIIAGQLGHDVIEELRGRGHDVLGPYHETLDVTDRDAAGRIFAEGSISNAIKSIVNY